MKKKLIAIVASLAMVATMVPATAFATASLTASFVQSDIVADSSTAMADAANLNAQYAVMKGAGNEDNVLFTNSGSSLIVSGVVPYTKGFTKFSTTESLQSGNYLGVKLATTNGATANKAWYLQVQGTHTVKNNKVVTTKDLIRVSDANAEVADTSIFRLPVDKKSYTLYQLSVDSGFASNNGSAINNLWFGNVETADLPDTHTSHKVGKDSDFENLTKDLTNGVSKIEVGLDLTGLTLLDEADTDALNEFIEIVGEINGNNITSVTGEEAVTPAYKRHVANAEAAYEALTAGQKEIIEKTVSQPQKKNYKKAYEALELAKKNVASDSAVTKVKEEIDKLPTLPTTAFADKAAIEAAYTPMATAEKDFAALTTAQKTNVDNSGKLTTYRANYDKLIKAYVDPLYAKAAAIDLEKELSDADIALISELKGYVDGKYIDTKNIYSFTQAKYDALVAALDKAEKDAKSLANAEVTVAGADSIVYDGTKKTPAVTVTIGGKEVAADAYDTIYNDNKDAGEATITIIPKDESGYTGKKEATFTIKAAALTADMVKIANATYTGKAVRPAVSVASGVDYTVAYNNNTAVGKASAVVTGTGNYTGTITKNFIVKPAKESITSLKAGKKQITVAYKAQTGAKYRVICKASGLKAVGTNTTATKKTVKKLKSGKTYQVKVRAYKAVDGTTYYGAYSAVKKVKVK